MVLIKFATCPPVGKDNRCPAADYETYKLPCKRTAVYVTCTQTGKPCPFAGQ